MSLYDYRKAQEIQAEDHPFYALIMCAMKQADTTNAAKLREAFPEVHAELAKRYDAPGGILENEAVFDDGYGESKG